MNNFFLAIATVVLLPMVPAYILFKFLPTDAGVDGPFSGLKLKLTGAFGGYFIVLLAVMYFFRILQSDKVEIWTIKGQVIAPEVTDMADLKISPTPDQNHKTPDLAFKMRVLVSRDDNGKPDFPDFVIEHPLYHTQTIHLATGQQGCNFTMGKGEINITGDCLKLSKVSEQPSYETQLDKVTEH